MHATVLPSFKTSRGLTTALSVAGQLGLPLGFSAVGITATAAAIAGHTPSASLLVASFALVLPSYGIDRLADMGNSDAIAYPERAAFYRRFRKPLLFCYLALGLAALGLAASIGWWAVAYVSGFPLSVVLYAVPFLPRGFRIRRFKDIPLGKNVYLSLCWAALVPMACLWIGVPLTSASLALCAYVFALVAFGATVCDLKDEHGDRDAGIQTLPTVLGRRGTLRLLRRFNAAAALAVAGLVVVGSWPLFMLVSGLVSAVLNHACLRYLDRSDADLELVGDLISDGVIALWAPLLLLFAF
jgi:4-hydroxybenzoate polyprenyltransferase